MLQTSPLELFSPNVMREMFCTQSPSIHGNLHPRKSTTRSTIKNSLQSLMLSSTGDVTARAQFIKYRCSRIIKTSNTSRQLKYSIAGRHAGRKSSPASTSKSFSALALRTASQTHYPDVRSIALRKGGVRTSQSPRFYTLLTSRAESVRLDQVP